MNSSESVRLRFAMAQHNFVVGDIEGNAEKVISAAQQARDHLQADVILFPELTLTGYPPEDLLLRSGLHSRVLNSLEHIRQSVTEIALILGYPLQGIDGCFNAASLIEDGVNRATYHKQLLPNYSVFDEKRYFTPGTSACVVDIKGIPVGITICEDAWNPGPMRLAADHGAKVIVNLNASPFHIEKTKERETALRQRAQECQIPIIYTNLVGGQDELVFDGESFVMNAMGEVCQRAPAFAEGLYVVELSYQNDTVEILSNTISPLLSIAQSAYEALVMGVRDYIHKNRFQGIVLGLSGGIDSALSLAIAVDAIGADRVEAVSLPSRYTQQMSIDDALAQAQALQVECKVISIEPMFRVFLDSLKDEFSGYAVDATEENIQARCRGVILMAISNKKGKMLLTTGNKSEMAVGYATLYGDMAGGFCALKDVPKTLVYQLAEYRNGIAPVIPQRVIDRPPSAELAPDQVDQDSLPAYDILDGILQMYVEEDQCIEHIVAAGYDLEQVRHVVKLVDRNEYKRRQAAPGVRITRRAFGRDRRYPITSGFGRS